LINAGFAEAHGIGPGVDIRIILNGLLETFLVTGIALSAEYVYAVKPGLPIPDDRYFARSCGSTALPRKEPSRWKAPSMMR
jgi:putative ABC transport system permease protein